MSETITYAPMTTSFLLWRCLHGGPLSTANLDRPGADSQMSWDALRTRNLPVLDELTRRYGACAMLAWEEGRVVGVLRFYPRAVAALPEAGGMCLQQDFPAGPSSTLLEALWPIEALEDRTLSVHCLMVGVPSREPNAYQRRGIATGLARALAEWAKAQGWEAIEATAYADLPTVYSTFGQAGVTFWERLGYRVVATEAEPAFEEPAQDDVAGLLEAMRREAAERRMDPGAVALRHTMRLELR